MPDLTLDDVRAVVTTPLSDDALRFYLQAEEDAVVERYGPLDELTETIRGGGRVLTLRRAVAEVVSVDDRYSNVPWELTDSDYTFTRGQQYLFRDPFGPNSAAIWGDAVTVVYTPHDDTNDRNRVVLQLIALDVTYQPGKAGEAMGSWSTQYRADYQAERAAILASLTAVVDPLFY